MPAPVSVPPDHETSRIRSAYAGYQTSPPDKWGNTNPGERRMSLERRVRMEQLLHRTGLRERMPELRILDVGCGVGNVLARFQEWGAVAQNLHGVDLLETSIATARKMHPALHFEVGNGVELPFAEHAFDLVLTFTLFSSVLDDAYAQKIAAQVHRVLRPGGSILWYDLRRDNPSNRNVRGVSRAMIARLFPGYGLRLESITLVPPLARRLGRLTGALYPCLAALPLLRTHYLGLLTKPNER